MQKEIEKADWIVGGLDGQEDGDETHDVIDLTMSSPVERSSLIPTSSPDRAENEIVRVRGFAVGSDKENEAPTGYRQQ